jgi:hypothetical protein
MGHVVHAYSSLGTPEGVLSWLPPEPVLKRGYV